MAFGPARAEGSSLWNTASALTLQVKGGRDDLSGASCARARRRRVSNGVAGGPHPDRHSNVMAFGLARAEGSSLWNTASALTLQVKGGRDDLSGASCARARRRRVSNGVAGGPHPDRHSNVMAFGLARAEGSSLWNTASALTLQVKGGRDDLSGASCARARRRRVSNGVAGGPHPDRHSNVMAFGLARAEGSSLWNTASALTLQVKGGRDDLSGASCARARRRRVSNGVAGGPHPDRHSNVMAFGLARAEGSSLWNTASALTLQVKGGRDDLSGASCARARRRRVSNGVAGGPHPDRHSNVMAFGLARAEGSSLWNTASALTLQVKGGRDDLSGASCARE